MRLLVTGGRDYRDGAHVSATLDAIHAKTPVTLLIEGGAKGADMLAHLWAQINNVPIKTWHADWNALGPAAGPRRNQRMIDEGKPNAYIDFPGGAGTADCVRRCKAAGIPKAV